MNTAAATARDEEIGKAGAAEAADALARLLRSTVALQGVDVGELTSLPLPPGSSVVGSFVASGGVQGNLAIVVDDSLGLVIANKLLGTGALDAGAIAALAEVGNILASAFLNGAARLCGRACLPSVPHMSHGPLSSLLPQLLGDGRVVQARIVVDGQLLFLLWRQR